MGNPQWVDEIVFLIVNKRVWFWKKHVCRDLSSHERLALIVVKQGKKKKSSTDELVSGSRE